MAEIILVRIPQQTVNDDEVLLQQWRVSDGESVAQGQILAEVETSKSVFEITSPATGTIELKVQQGREAAIGDILCLIHTEAPDSVDQISEEDKPKERRRSQTNESGATVVAEQGTRFSRRAMNRLQELGKDSAEFEGRGLVRLRDIESSTLADGPGSIKSDVANSLSGSRRGQAQLTPDSSIAAAPIWKSVTGVEFDSSMLSRSKRRETKLLSWSSRQAIQSTVSVFVPTLGQNVLQAIIPDIGQVISAQIISATATLLPEYPAFNACCLDNEVRHYRDVNIGFAVDAGHGLKVAVIRSADKLLPEQICEARARLIAAYLENQLQPEQLSGATFTISDLSGAGVSTFHPLISEGQSAILGIGAEIRESHNQSGYQLILSFDHRLAEGRLAAMFLTRIREQMILFERRILEESSSLAFRFEPECSQCGMTSSTAAQRQHFLTETVAADWTTRLVCTICLHGG